MQLAPRLHRQRTVLIVGALPLRMRGEQRRHVGRVVGDHQLLIAAADEEGRVAGRVAGRIDEADAGGNLLLAFDQLEILPGREHGVDARAERLAGLGQLLDPARLRPPFVLGGAHDQLGVGEHGRIGALLHQAEDVVGMEVRDQDGADLGRDRCRRPACWRRACRPSAATARPSPESTMISLSPTFRTTTVSGIDTKSVVSPALASACLGVIDAGVLDERRIVRLLPDAVVEGGDLDRADLVFVEALGGVGRLLRVSRTDEGKPLVEPEGGGESCRDDEMATREVEH